MDGIDLTFLWLMKWKRADATSTRLKKLGKWLTIVDKIVFVAHGPSSVASAQPCSLANICNPCAQARPVANHIPFITLISHLPPT
jgi:hypothetical protein